MHIRLEDRVALVTGAAQGIGQAIARSLRAAGATVHVADRDAAGLDAFARAEGLPHHALDVSDRAAGKTVVERIDTDNGRLDILVNAAGGVCGQVGRPIEDVAEADWREIFSANVDGAFWLSQAASGPMRRAASLPSGA